MATLTVENFDDFAQKAPGAVKLAAGKLETIERAIAFFTTHNIDWQSLTDTEVAASWGPHKSLAVKYLWAYKQFYKNKI